MGGIPIEVILIILTDIIPAWVIYQKTNINRQIRKFFPKGKSIDYLHECDTLNNNLVLLDTPIKSLDEDLPKETFKVVYGEDLFYKRFT